PFACRTRLDSIPAAVPYLHADPDRRRLWDGILGPKTGRRIGLAWSGSASHQNDRNRSLGAAQFAPLLTGDAQFFSVQKEMRTDDAALLDVLGIRHFGERIRDFADTAALMTHMDLVISVDTSVAHLAGALGVPVWVLLAFSPD